MLEFQVVVLKCQKNIAKKLLEYSDMCIFVGDWNNVKINPDTGLRNEMWWDTMSGKPSPLLPEGLKVEGYCEPDDSFVSNWNGYIQSNIDSFNYVCSIGIKFIMQNYWRICRWESKWHDRIGTIK
jgi:hypothetical protein